MPRRKLSERLARHLLLYVNFSHASTCLLNMEEHCLCEDGFDVEDFKAQIHKAELITAVQT